VRWFAGDQRLPGSGAGKRAPVTIIPDAVDDETTARVRRTEVSELLQRLITCDTSNPPGRETQVVAILERYLLDAGLECERVAKDPDRANLLARLPGDGSGPSLAFLGHADVVQTRREDWQVDPFAGIERDGVVWGRGAVDMKCQVAAAAVALATLAREGFRPRGDLMLLVLADEEVATAGVGSTWFVQQRPDLRPDFVVGEGAGERHATPDGPLYLLDCGVKASAKATLTAFGRPGDASLPDPGPSALRELARLLDRLPDHPFAPRVVPELHPLLEALAGDRAAWPGRIDAARGSADPLDQILLALTTTVVHATVAASGEPVNQLPDRATATLQCALVPGTSADELEAELREALGDGRYTLEIGPVQGGSTSDPDTPLRHAIAAFLAEADPEARLLPALGYGYSDCDVMRTAYGSVAYGFIPFRHGDPAVNLTTKHGADERILVDDLEFQLRAALSVARAMGRAGSPERD
jgi:acetylornithine deacetylase/succinyl-diaminopimelate desuccinylase-like protein